MAEEQFKPPVMYSDGKTEWPLDPNTGVPTPQTVSINSDTDGLKNNKDWANRAIEWSNRNVRFASNRSADLLVTGGKSAICVALMRRSHKNVNTRSADIADIRANAKTAAKYGCGNCEEMSSTAFIWLYDYYLYTNKNAALAWMEVKGGDHLFVLIGFPQGKASLPGAWGPRSVVVDPWNRKFYPGSQIRTERFYGFREVYGPLLELP